MAPTSRYWSAYWADRRRLGHASAVALDEQLTVWMVALVQAEMTGAASDHPGASGKIERLELPGFEVLIRVRLDEGGAVDHIDFFGVRER